MKIENKNKNRYFIYFFVDYIFISLISVLWNDKVYIIWILHINI
jgi:hypothetical protein